MSNHIRGRNFPDLCQLAAMELRRPVSNLTELSSEELEDLFYLVESGIKQLRDRML
jgi:hypothetical protein